VEMVTIIQALRYLDLNGKLSSITRERMKVLRELVPAFKEDISLSPVLEKVKVFMKDNDAYKSYEPVKKKETGK
jgi:histidine ammonia-lyase